MSSVRVAVRQQVASHLTQHNHRSPVRAIFTSTISVLHTRTVAILLAVVQIP